jgi:hypothetical protein
MPHNNITTIFKKKNPCWDIGCPNIIFKKNAGITPAFFNFDFIDFFTLSLLALTCGEFIEPACRRGRSVTL